MKPYRKTFRASKVHKASDCNLCKEDTGSSKSAVRHEARNEIEKAINAIEVNQWIETKVQRPENNTRVDVWVKNEDITVDVLYLDNKFYPEYCECGNELNEIADPDYWTIIKRPEN